MKRPKKKLKAIVLSMVLAAGMLLPASATAQEDSEELGGLFGKNGFLGSRGTGLFEISEQKGEDKEYGITNQGIGEPAPLGSGLFILLGAGLGYVALKKKEDEQ